jgi:cell division septation protein DedD
MSNRTLVTVFAIPLLVLAGCSREKSDWRSAQAADSPESYAQFISAHPESAKVAAARERLQQLAEEKDWRGAAETDTLEAYHQFLAQHPGGKWAREAQVRIDNFASAQSPVTGAAAANGVNAGAPGAGPDLPQPGVSSPADSVISSGFGVQLGAFSTAERANAEWTKLQSAASSTLDGLSPRVVVGEASGKPIYRLQAEVRDEAQARAVCGGLKAADKACVVIIPR